MQRSRCVPSFLHLYVSVVEGRLLYMWVGCLYMAAAIMCRMAQEGRRYKNELQQDLVRISGLDVFLPVCLVGG